MSIHGTTACTNALTAINAAVTGNTFAIDSSDNVTETGASGDAVVNQPMAMALGDVAKLNALIGIQDSLTTHTVRAS